MNFAYNRQEQLPPLAWLAVFTKDSETVEVSCGDAVVCTEEWFAAGVGWRPEEGRL